MKSDRFQEIGHVEGQTLLLCFFFGKDCEKKLHLGIPNGNLEQKMYL
jgi:hypothetical protein